MLSDNREVPTWEVASDRRAFSGVLVHLQKLNIERALLSSPKIILSQCVMQNPASRKNGSHCVNLCMVEARTAGGFKPWLRVTRLRTPVD